MDIDSLLQPLSRESPCGEDLSFSIEFDTLQEKRREDDASLDQGEWIRPLKLADWPGVVTQCSELLKNRSKDLRVAVWLTEAMGRTQGFAGIADGLSLCARLCDRFWDRLHPMPDDGDLEQRIGILTVLLRLLPELTLIAPVIGSGNKRHGLREIEGARIAHQAAAKSGQADAAAPAGALGWDDVVRLRGASGKDAIAIALEGAGRALAALGDLEAAVDARLGDAGPGFTTARRAFEDAIDSADRLSREGQPATSAVAGASPHDVFSTPAAASHGSGSDHAMPMAGGAPGAPQSRAQALRQLRLVADFFRHTEPHSPVTYLADKAARWGEMPLHTWLRVVLKDPGALAHVEELLGIEPPPQT